MEQLILEIKSYVHKKMKNFIFKVRSGDGYLCGSIKYNILSVLRFEHSVTT